MPSAARYAMRTAFALMVTPFSRSRSMASSTFAAMSRRAIVPVISRKRSARVDLPWSMWAMMQKLRMRLWSMRGQGSRDDLRWRLSARRGGVFPRGTAERLHQAALHHLFGDLQRVKRGALADVVGRDPHRDALRVRHVL